MIHVCVEFQTPSSSGSRIFIAVKRKAEGLFHTPSGSRIFIAVKRKAEGLFRTVTTLSFCFIEKSLLKRVGRVA